MEWTPATEDWVVAELKKDLATLHPNHQEQLSACLVNPYSIPVDDCPGETVIVIAKIMGEILYYSDVEDGWVLDVLTSTGGTSSRGCNQFELSHIVHQKFGEPQN